MKNSDRELEAFVIHAQEGDVSQVRKWNKYMHEGLAREMQNADWGTLTMGMAAYFAQQAAEEDWRRWGFRDKEARDELLKKMMRAALRERHMAVADIFLRSDVEFNTGFSNFHPISDVLTSSLDSWSKAAFVEKLLEKGIDKVKAPERFVETAAQAGAALALATLLKAGLRPEDGRRFLLSAADDGQYEIARLLAEKGGADIDEAIRVSRVNAGNWKLLETVRDDIAKERARDAEIAELRAAVKALTAKVDEMQSPALDKLPVPRPTVHGGPLP